jgi:peptidoglycan-associated lipoprotein
MKLASKNLFLLLTCAAAVFIGCAKKPIRPDPSSTLMGPQGGGAGALTPTEVPTTADLGTSLQARDPNIIETADTIRGLLQPAYFDFDRSTIKAGERPKIQAVKDYLDKNPQYRVLIEAHCDWRGTAEYNLALGDRRANSAKKYLLTLGVPVARVETVSKGSEEAVKTGDDATWAKDRRDDFVVLKK